MTMSVRVGPGGGGGGNFAISMQGRGMEAADISTNRTHGPTRIDEK